jgi:hypothetical protein
MAISKAATPTEIEILAKKILDEEEIKLASRLSTLMKISPSKASSLMRDILPVYHKNLVTHEPRMIYRYLYYVEDYSRGAQLRRLTRFFIHMVCGHLEACLYELAKGRQLPYGPLVYKLLKKRVLSQQLADQLLEFNNVVYIPAKHFVARENLPRKINKRTFAVEDGALAFIMMRKLSMQLFKLLKSGVTTLPEDWKPFKKEWLVWDREDNNDFIIIE